MIYWILTDIGGKHARRHDGNWEPLNRRRPASDEVERFHRAVEATAKAKKLKSKDCHCKPLRQEGIVFRSARQAAAWKKRALAEGCEVIECRGRARK
jgi:hypothetical protein